MKTISEFGLGVALLALVAGCGSESPSVDHQALSNELNVAENGMIVDPEIPNAAVGTNAAAAPEPAGEPAAANGPATAPVPPPAPKAPPRAKADAPKPKAPAPEPDPHAGHDMNEM